MGNPQATSYHWSSNDGVGQAVTGSDRVGRRSSHLPSPYHSSSRWWVRNGAHRYGRCLAFVLAYRGCGRLVSLRTSAAGCWRWYHRWHAFRRCQQAVLTSSVPLYRITLPFVSLRRLLADFHLQLRRLLKIKQTEVTADDGSAVVGRARGVVIRRGTAGQIYPPSPSRTRCSLERSSARRRSIPGPSREDHEVMAHAGRSSAARRRASSGAPPLLNLLP